MLELSYWSSALFSGSTSSFALKQHTQIQGILASRYNCRPEISKMGRELQKWAEPPKWGVNSKSGQNLQNGAWTPKVGRTSKWGGVSSHKDFHHWLWVQPIVIDLHFKITLYILNIVSSLSKIKCCINQYFPWEESPKLVASGVRTGFWTSASWYKRESPTSSPTRRPYHTWSHQ